MIFGYLTVQINRYDEKNKPFYFYMEPICNRNVWLHLLRVIFENIRPSSIPLSRSRERLAGRYPFSVFMEQYGSYNELYAREDVHHRTDAFAFRNCATAR